MMLKNDAVKDAALWARLYSTEGMVGTMGGVQCTMGTVWCGYGRYGMVSRYGRYSRYGGTMNQKLKTVP